MYFYFYDKLTQEKKYEPVLAKIETRLIDLGINGRIEKLSIFKNARELIQDGVKKGAHTVVAVGDDKTFATVINMVARQKVALGFIPLHGNSRFARVLGIPQGEGACDVLSKRLCETVDLGCIQQFYFLGAIEATSDGDISIRCDDQYTIHPREATSHIRILNMGDILNSTEPRIASATDGKLEVVITPPVSPQLFKRFRSTTTEMESVFPVRQLTMTTTGEPITLNADQCSTFHTPCSIEVIPRALKIIVGRERAV